MTRLVCLIAKRHSGKSACATYLRQQAGFRNIKFAGPLKDMLRAAGMTEDQLEGPDEIKEGVTDHFRQFINDPHRCSHAMIYSLLNEGDGRDIAFKMFDPVPALQGKSIAYFKALLDFYIIRWGTEPGITPRKIMQELGTEIGRVLCGEKIWTDRWEQQAQRYALVSTDDLRFPNEWDQAWAAFPDIVTIGIIRPNNPIKFDPHPSEAFIDKLIEKCHHKLISEEGKLHELCARVHGLAMGPSMNFTPASS